MYNYIYYLVGISLVCVILEIILPWNKKKYSLGEYLPDIFFLIFNGVLFSLIISTPVEKLQYYLFSIPLLSKLPEIARLKFCSDLPLYFELPILLLLKDLMEYLIHRMLHSIGFLWRYHRLHHSIKEMYWAGNFRFHWMEIIVYDSLKFFPLYLLGFSLPSIFIVGVFSTLIGHLNHTNIKMDYGPLRYLLNSPAIHIYHHDYICHFKNGQNFGVVLCIWDRLLGTLHYPRFTYPERLGFKQDEQYPHNFFKRFFSI